MLRLIRNSFIGWGAMNQNEEIGGEVRSLSECFKIEL